MEFSLAINTKGIEDKITYHHAEFFQKYPNIEPENIILTASSILLINNEIGLDYSSSLIDGVYTIIEEETSLWKSTSDDEIFDEKNELTHICYWIAHEIDNRVSPFVRKNFTGASQVMVTFERFFLPNNALLLIEDQNDD